jgi:hypothetical protein
LRTPKGSKLVRRVVQVGKLLLVARLTAVFFLTRKAHDLVGADAAAQMQTDALLADKAFDADARPIEPLLAQEGKRVIPPESHRKVQRAFDEEKARHLVEKIFCRFKRAIATRCDKTVSNNGLGLCGHFGLTEGGPCGSIFPGETSMFKENIRINFDARAELKKWPSLNNQRRSSTPPYMVFSGTLAECVRTLMTKPVKSISLYDIVTSAQAAFDQTVLSPADAAEIAMREDFPKD